MFKFAKPNILASQCLGFAKCRYNGDTIPDKTVAKLANCANFTTVCPEVEIGLGVPRQPIRIVEEGGKQELYQPATQKKYTAKMEKFTREYLGRLEAPDGIIFKSSSPSCGPSGVKIYQGYDPGQRPNFGSGLFAREARQAFPAVAIEDEGRLKNFTIRENFFTAIFLSAEFRELRPAGSMDLLVKFHTRNKYLLMAHSQQLLRELGRIVANHAKLGIGEVLRAYEDRMREALAKPPTFKSWINVFHHLYGYFSRDLAGKEREFFLNSIEEYRDERIPLSALAKAVEALALRFDNEYVLSQSILNPFPRELVEITDSGKGRSR